MPYLQYFGLLIALVVAPLLLALFKWLRFNPLSPVPRFSLWVAAAIVLAVAAATSESWVAYSGLGLPPWSNIGLAVLGAVAMLLMLGLSQYFQRKFGASSSKQLDQYRSVLRLPHSHRLFLVVTAAVTEEVLYRGYAIGVGQHLLGSVWLACALSVAAFTLAHIRWGLAHLLPVLFGALIFTLLFALSHNLWTCIIAHAIVDAVGFLVVPAIMARRHPTPLPHAS